jgi:hypothetical protein
MERTLDKWHYSSWIMGAVFIFLTLLSDSAIDQPFIRKAFGTILRKYLSGVSVGDFRTINTDDVFSLIHQCHRLDLKEETIIITRKVEKTTLDRDNPKRAFEGFLLPLARRLCDADSLDEALTLELPKKILLAYASRIVGPEPDSQAETWESNRISAQRSLREYFDDKALNKVLGPAVESFLL